MTPPPDVCVPYARRRNTPAQLSFLNQLFDATPHPTRAQRQALADEIGMELKSVTNWFQNRRQTSRRKPHSNIENSPPKTRLPHSPARHRQRRPKTPLDRSKISLDRIAALSERPSLTLQLNSTRSPLTPRKSSVEQRGSASPSKLWTHMLSSPVAPPPSPSPEGARLAALSSQERILLYPLEWACLKARQKKWVDEDAEESTRRGLRCCKETDGEKTDRDPPGLGRFFSRPNITPQLEDVEAAITLLGFKTRS